MTIKDFANTRDIRLTALKKVVLSVFGEPLTEFNDTQVDLLDRAIADSATYVSQKSLPASEQTQLQTQPLTMKQIEYHVGAEKLTTMANNFNLVLRKQSYEVLNETQRIVNMTQAMQSQLIHDMYANMGKNMVAVSQEFNVSPVSKKEDLLVLTDQEKEDIDLVIAELNTL